MNKLWLVVAGAMLCGTPAIAVQTHGDQPDRQFTFDCTKPDSVEILSACAQMNANQLAMQSNIIAESAVNQEARAMITSRNARNDAQIAMWASVASAFASLLGTIFLFFTLQDGRKTANAAVQALEVGRAMLMPKRPFFIVTLVFQPNGDLGFCKLRCGVEWQNVGERPALHVSKLIRLSIVPKGGPVPTIPSAIQATEWITVEQGRDVLDSFKVTNMVDIESYLTDQKDFYLVSSVAFRDRVKPHVNYKSHLVLKVNPVDLQALKNRGVTEFDARMDIILENNVDSDESSSRINAFTMSIAKLLLRRKAEKVN